MAVVNPDSRRKLSSEELISCVETRLSNFPAESPNNFERTVTGGGAIAMLSALRGGALSSSRSAVAHRWKTLASSYPISGSNFSSSAGGGVEKYKELLSLAEVEKVLEDVKADDVRVITAPKDSEFADYMVIATGRSPWHVRNISQALIYKAGSLAPVNDVSLWMSFLFLF